MVDSLLTAALPLAGIDLLRVGLFTYLWRSERARHLGWWTGGIALQAVAENAMVWSMLEPAPRWLAPGSIVLVVVASLLLLRGTYHLLDRPWSSRWVLAAAAVLVAGPALAWLPLPLAVRAAPPALFLATVLATMGLRLGWSSARPPGDGAVVAGVALLASALHFLDFPLLSHVTWFVPWGVGIGVVNVLAVSLGLVLVHLDATRAERDAAERRHAELADAVGVGTYERGADGRFTRVNDALVRMLGHADAAAVCALDVDRDVFADPIGAAVQGADAAVDVLAGLDVEWKRKDGSCIAVQLHGRVVRDGAGRVVGHRGFVVDRSDARRLEERLRKSEKLEAVGRLAGGVAHDFNNLLTIIRTNHALVARTELAPAAREALDDAEAAAVQAAQLTRRLLAFGRRPTAVTEAVEVGTVIRRTARLLETSLGGRHRVVLTGDEPSRWIRLDAGGLEQVVVNLVLNARDAMAEGGDIELTVGDGARDGRPGVTLEVRDHGTGIAPEHLARVFEPFFTTKPVGRGTGLGLSTVQGLVVQAGGAIDIDTTPGRGSRFSIWFPAATASTPVVAPVTDDGGPLRVLVADDEAPIRRTIARMIDDEQVLLVEASSGGEVVARHRAGERFDVVLSDVRMPGGDGPAAVRVVRELAPATRIVLMSGHVDALDVEEPGLVDGFLAKPFSRPQLLAAVRGARAAAR